MDIRTLMAARLYVRDTANSLGAVKGSPCTITSITEADDGIHIVFSWTGTDGTVATQTAIMPYVAVDKVAREAVETLRDDMDAAIDTTVRSINGRTPDSAGNVALPLAVTGVPNTGSPHQVFVTNGEGVPMWDDRRHWLELAAICPEVLTDPDVEILYDAEKTEIAAGEYKDNTDIEVVYFPNVETVNNSGLAQSISYDSRNLKAVILPNVKTLGLYSLRNNRGLAYVYAPNCEYVGASSFQRCYSLKKVCFPGVVSITKSGPVFAECTSLTDISFPNCTDISGGMIFEGITALPSIHFPKLETVTGTSVFRSCSALKKADFPVLKNIGAQMFNWCSAFETLILRSSTMCTLANVNAFLNTPIASGTGYIYVPSALIEEYKAATNWSTYAAQFRAIEDWPEICGEDVDEYITKGEAAKLIDEKLGVIENGTY